MHIVFTPALPDTVHVAVPADSLSSNHAVLNFTATLHVADHDELRRNRASLQLWSDIPFDHATASPGDWVACDFEEVTAPGGASAASTTEVLLGDVRRDYTESQERSVLSLQICVPLADNGQSRFAFTYRLVYPSGEIRWLGEYGQNGTLVVERTDPALILADGWVPGEGGLVWTAADRAAHTDSVVIRLMNSAEYAVWTLGRDSTGKPPLAFFVPRLEPSSVYIPPTYVLHGSSDTTISILSDDAISVFSEAGSLLLKLLPSRQPELNTLVNDNLARSSPDRVQVAILGEDAGHLIVASKGTYPIQGFIVPTTTRSSKQIHTPVTVPLATLRALLPPQTTSFTFFSPRNRNIHFFTGSTEMVTIRDDAVGSPFVLSPVVGLKGGECHVSILSHYLSAQPSENNLPTPPPSPQLRPIAHPALSRLSPSGSGTSSLSGSVLSLPEVAAAQDKAHETQKDEEDEEILDRQLNVRPLASLLARLKLLCYVVLFILTTALKQLFWTLDLDKHGNDADLVEEQCARPTDGDSDADATSTPMVPLPQVTVNDRVSGHGSKQEPSSLLAELNGGVALIALRVASAVMDGPRGTVVVEMSGRDVDVKETRVGDGESLLEFDGGEGGMVRIFYST